ncbi:MAG: hypothetical protein JWO76_1471 [Nocardioides sp.]|nr:hypothetical protein [Nocardioides sp.]
MTVPTFAEVSLLPASNDFVVPREFEDQNGHMNIQHYLGIAGDGVDRGMVPLGVPQDWPQTAGLGVFSAEQHLTFVAEVHAGDRVTFHLRLLERSDRGVHAVGYLLDQARARVSFVLEAVWLHVDMTVRRTAVWPAAVAALLDERIASDSALGWTPVLSAPMALRHRVG